MKKILLPTLLFSVCISNVSCAASFDCTKAGTSVEKLICNNETISKQDEDLAKTYKNALDSTTKKDELKKQQIAWLKIRNVCKDETCVTQSYQNRILELSSQELKKVTAESSSNKTPVTKKPITFKLIDGSERPICQQYLQMLTATKYTEFPACERKVLPDFPQFKAVDWTEITDKQEMTRIIEERFKINSKMDSLQATPPSLSISERSDLLEYIRKDELKMYSYEIDINGDGVIDVIYRIDMKDPGSKKYNQCEIQSIYYVDDSKVTVNTITEKTKNYYRGFNFSDSSNELFLFNSIIYSSDWAGKFISAGSNLDIYEVGNNKLCGILVK